MKKISTTTKANGAVVEMEVAAGRPARATGRGGGARGRRRSAVGCNPITAIFSEFSQLNVAVGHTKMLRIDCFGETRLVLHVPSSS